MARHTEEVRGLLGEEITLALPPLAALHCCTVGLGEGNRFVSCVPVHQLPSETLRNHPGHEFLAEARRVLRPGGQFLCLEFSKVVLPILDDIYDRYSFSVLPQLGRWVARDEAAYRYLAESIRQFPDQQTLARMIGDAGLEQVRVQNLSGGIAAIHTARRI